MCVFLSPWQSEKHKDDEDARIKASGQVVAPSLYFTKQSAYRGCEWVGGGEHSVVVANVVGDLES